MYEEDLKPPSALANATKTHKCTCKCAPRNAKPSRMILKFNAYKW